MGDRGAGEQGSGGERDGRWGTGDRGAGEQGSGGERDGRRGTGDRGGWRLGDLGRRGGRGTGDGVDAGLRSFATGLRSSVSGQPSSPALRRSDSRPSGHRPIRQCPCLPVYLSTCLPISLSTCLLLHQSTKPKAPSWRRLNGDETVPGGEEPEICTSGFSLALVIPDKKLGLYGVIPYLSRKKDPIFGGKG